MLVICVHPELLEGDDVVRGVGEIFRDGGDTLNAIFGNEFEAPWCALRFCSVNMACKGTHQQLRLNTLIWWFSVAIASKDGRSSTPHRD